MKNIIENIFGFLYTLSMGDYVFFVGTFVLLLVFVYILFLIKRDDAMELKEKNNESETLNDIKETIEKEYKPTTVKLTDYEEEQEKNAIISYEELLKNKNNIGVAYDEDYSYENEEIKVKKININKNGKIEEVKNELHVKLMNYDKEEEFLIALKQLQQNLTN